MYWRISNTNIPSGFWTWLGNISLEKSARKKPYAWLPDQGWEDLIHLSELFPEKFESLPDDVEKNPDVWKNVRAFLRSLVFFWCYMFQCDATCHSARQEAWHHCRLLPRPCFSSGPHLAIGLFPEELGLLLFKNQKNLPWCTVGFFHFPVKCFRWVICPVEAGGIFAVDFNSQHFTVLFVLLNCTLIFLWQWVL